MQVLVFYNHGNTCRLYGAVQFIEPSTKLFFVSLKTTLGSRKGRNANFVNCDAEIDSLKMFKRAVEHRLESSDFTALCCLICSPSWAGRQRARGFVWMQSSCRTCSCSGGAGTTPGHRRRVVPAPGHRASQTQQPCVLTQSRLCLPVVKRRSH